MDQGRLLIPVFSLSRSQEILTNLYDLFGNDKTFKIPIVLDSPLIWEITKVYKEVLTGENKELFDKVCEWKNVRFIKDYNESKLCLEDNSPKIVLSSSGFLCKGRSVSYLKKYITDSKSYILMVGYSPPGSIASKIKNGQKTITIEGKSYKNKCGLTVLNSFSSHIGQIELLNYLKNINSERIYLVHGSEESKLEFKELLEDELLKMCKTTKVICTNKGTICTL
jgi:metallo-beta-lactamase family protein